MCIFKISFFALHIFWCESYIRTLELRINVSHILNFIKYTSTKRKYNRLFIFETFSLFKDKKYFTFQLVFIKTTNILLFNLQSFLRLQYSPRENPLGIYGPQNIGPSNRIAAKNQPSSTSTGSAKSEPAFITSSRLLPSQNQLLSRQLDCCQVRTSFYHVIWIAAQARTSFHHVNWIAAKSEPAFIKSSVLLPSQSQPTSTGLLPSQNQP
jgi:hypothetical protein